jgi:hypothetical protein
VSSDLRPVTVVTPYTTGNVASLTTSDGHPALSDSGVAASGVVSSTAPLVLTGQTSTPGSSAGTLTNAPAAGNPQTWLQVTINGVVHWIPAWHT